MSGIDKQARGKLAEALKEVLVTINQIGGVGGLDEDCSLCFSMMRSDVEKVLLSLKYHLTPEQEAEAQKMADMFL